MVNKINTGLRPLSKISKHYDGRAYTCCTYVCGLRMHYVIKSPLGRGISMCSCIKGKTRKPLYKCLGCCDSWPDVYGRLLCAQFDVNSSVFGYGQCLQIDSMYKKVI